MNFLHNFEARLFFLNSVASFSVTLPSSTEETPSSEASAL
ncbi:hypothetical protein AtDm6_1322 [Acetobacter tropicalis]|uniref:Uncharacterized protein n=1 Tax=Acetobacter tropicalis TaxID=104102 RepID=A0A094YRZ5_9PROT|nr:hypothetical protein AtDm6_1322 [Acetobacter tropicalis]